MAKNAILTENMKRMSELNAPLRLDDDGNVRVEYGYNSGGYENYVYFVTADGGVLAIDTVIDEINKTVFSDKSDPQWFIVGYGVNYEDAYLRDDHTGELIECAYSE